MKAVFVCDSSYDLKRVYADRYQNVLADYDCPDEIFAKGDLANNRERLRNAELLFSTWGMPALTQEEIAAYFPNVKAVFYAAGSVQHFARPFLRQGIRVFSAWQANAVPVAEFTFSQIMLASKGFFQSVRQTSWKRKRAHQFFQAMPGNYECTVGLLGAGSIGTMVAQRLQDTNNHVLVFDPFLSDEAAHSLHVKKADLHTLFCESDVISNHLANNDQTKGMLDYECFRRMKSRAVFLNTGRGAQVVEEDLVRALREEKGRFALLDVTEPEPPKPLSKLNFCKNIWLTPHMAGSSGQEVWRMADYAIEQADAFRCGGKPAGEITLEMLEIIA